MIEIISPYIGMTLALIMILAFNFLAQPPKKPRHKRSQKHEAND